MLCSVDHLSREPERRVLLLHLRAARRRAREAAAAEALALLHDLGPRLAPGGPLAERGGVLWLTVPDEHLAAVCGRLPRLGYTEAADLLVPAGERSPVPPLEEGGPVRWRHRSWHLAGVHREDPDEQRDRAPDRRTFRLETRSGGMRDVRGYRGGEGPLAHRALPACDARLLVNLVAGASPGRLLDPFAGAGGIVVAARESGWSVVSVDLDPALRHGLTRLGAHHVVADARRLPLRDASVEAVATEPPYEPGTGPLLAGALREMRRVLRPGGAAALLCASWQAPQARASAATLRMKPRLDSVVDRKGLEVVALAWRT